MCNITSLHLYKKDGDSYSKYEPEGDMIDVIRFSEDFKSLEVRTDQVFIEELYITAQTISGNDGVKNPGANGGLIQVSLEVMAPSAVAKENVAPEFAEDLPKDIGFESSGNKTLVSVDG